MPFDPQAFLDQHGGDPIAALNALQKDRERATRSKNSILETLGIEQEQAEATAQALKAYQTLGKPDEIKSLTAKAKRLEQITQAVQAAFGEIPDKGLEEYLAKISETPKRLNEIETKAKQLESQQVIAQAASSYGYKDSVLARLLRQDGLEIAFDSEKERIIEQNGKPAKLKGVAVIKSEGKEIPLEEYATQNWGDFIPALSSAPAAPATPVLPPQTTGTGGKRTADELAVEKASSGMYRL